MYHGEVDQMWQNRVNQCSRDPREEQLIESQKRRDSVRKSMDLLAPAFLRIFNKGRTSLFDRSDLSLISIWGFASLCKGRRCREILEAVCVNMIKTWVKEKYGDEGVDIMRKILVFNQRESIFR